MKTKLIAIFVLAALAGVFGIAAFAEEIESSSLPEFSTTASADDNTSDVTATSTEPSQQENTIQAQ